MLSKKSKTDPNNLLKEKEYLVIEKEKVKRITKDEKK